MHNAGANIQAKQMSHFPRCTVAAEVHVCGSGAARRVGTQCVLGRFSFFSPLVCFPRAGERVSALFTSSHDISGGRTYAFDFLSRPPGGCILLPESPSAAPVASGRSLRSDGGDSADSWPPLPPACSRKLACPLERVSGIETKPRRS